jgi:arylsulfatase A
MTRVLLFLIIVSFFGSSLPAQDQPNIVLILADDLGIHDLRCYGRGDHRSPRLDALANQGIRYTSAYCGLSICSASRAALMTGKSPARLHLTSFLPGRPDAPSQLVLNARIQSALPPEERTLAEELKKAGYRTGLFGKWHLGNGDSSPTSQGFDVAYEPSAKGKLDEVEGNKNEFAIARRASDFILSPDPSPFFCYVPHHSPHIRLDATDEAKQSFQAAFNPLYAANIESLDKAVGFVLDAVQRRGGNRETIVIFSSDNGGLHVPEGHDEPMTHNSPFRAGKGYLYEGGIRIPLIVYSSKGRVGSDRVVDEPVSLLDLFPTLLRIAGIDVLKTVGPVDGVDLSSHWIEKKSLPTDRAFYWNFPHYTNQGSRPAAAMRRGEWKLIKHYEDPSIELYNLKNDPAETMNVAMSQADTAVAMQKSLEDWLQSVGAQGCDRNPNANDELHAAIYRRFDSSSIRADAGAKAIAEQWKPWRKLMNQAVQQQKPVLRSPSGEVNLYASDSKPHGNKIRYEPEPHKNVVGFWTDVNDWVHWDFSVPSDGIYAVEVQCGCGKGMGGSRVALTCGEQTLEWTVRDTGHFQNMVYESIGDLSLKAGENRLEVRPKSKASAAVMDIRKIVLRKK